MLPTHSHPGRRSRFCVSGGEYCKTVLDYALEFKNYPFIKFLMDHGYIWFDSGNDQEYFQTFGAGTSIERRQIGSIDSGFLYKLKQEDALRVELIALACDHRDIQTLEKLRARENPQLYYRAHYLSALHPDFDGNYNERMVKHIAKANDYVLDYFTEPFKIRDHVNYDDGSKRSHTFMFPYISQLLDYLIIARSQFAETAVKKAIKHNKETYQKLCELILSVKNDPRYEKEYMKDIWIKSCEQDLDFFENGSIVMFRALYSNIDKNNYIDGIITNVPHITKLPTSPALKHLVEELNDSYIKIRDLKEHLEEI